MLTQQQIDAYELDGYILVSGLIPPAIMENGTAKLLQYIDESHRYSDYREITGIQEIENDDDLLACFTPEVHDATVQLCGDSHETIISPKKITTVNVFPGQNENNLPYPHIDHAFKEDNHKIIPPPYRIATITYFSNVPENGGGTVVWPGSHHQLETLAQSDSTRYEYMYNLYENFDRVNLQIPVHLAPKMGDVLFYHYLCAHSGSSNLSDHPRLAMNHKWLAK